MQYREFGKTGAKVSRLGFGAMRLPRKEQEAVKILQQAFDLGINYVDTAPYYMDNQSELMVGKALKGYRDKVYLSTKNPIEDASGKNFRRRLEKSLQQLAVDYIDFYYMWSINLEVYQEKINVPRGPLEAALKAKEEGLIRHLCFSVHDIRENVMKIIDEEVFEAVLCQYNLLDREHEATLAYAQEKGLGTAVMGPVAGGRLGAPSAIIQKLIPIQVKSSAEMAFRFVFANPHVDIALSGMGSLQMVEENVSTASREEQLSPEEILRIKAIMEEKKKLADLYCTGCDYCLPCPAGVNIPENFRYLNHYRIYGLQDYAQEEYRLLGQEGHWVEGKPARECLQCGECEKKCPQKIGIIQQLQEVERILGQPSQRKLEVDWYPR